MESGHEVTKVPFDAQELQARARATLRATIDALLDAALVARETSHAAIVVTAGAEGIPFPERWAMRAQTHTLPVTQFEFDVLREALAARGA